MAGPQYYWLGDIFDWNGVTASDPTSDREKAFSFNIDRVGVFDTLSRIVVGYSFHTQIEDNATGVEKQPEPWAIAMWYTPLPPGDPDVESASVEDAMVGDALWTDILHWTPVRWTDGTGYGTQWHAHSGQPMSQKGQRVIHDKSTAHLNFGVASLRDSVPDESLMIPLELHGLIWFKILMKRF